MTGGGSEEPAWQLDRDTAVVRLGGMAFEAWDDWRRWGNYPYPGGRKAQPLDLLAQMRAIDLTYSTYMYRKQEKANLTKLSPTQNTLTAWLDKDDD